MSTSNTRRDFLRVAAGATAALSLASQVRAAEPAKGNGVVGLRAPALDRVRVGIIGVGSRGSGHLRTLMSLDGVEIVAIADNYPPALEKALAAVAKAKRPVPATYGKGDDDWKNLIERKDIDLVFVITPWNLHAPMGVAAMQAGKHVCIEVPIALTVEECWQLVDTAERMQKHCMMLENVCYGREELLCLNLCRLGVLGELIHGEGAYIHDLRTQMEQSEHGTGSWRTYQYAKRNGNLYPTHGIGSIAQYMGINRGDRFDYLSSVSSPARGRALYAKAKYPADHRWNKIDIWNGGDMNTSIIKTAKGRSILLQWDETSPRPYTRLNHIQGTKGAFASYPNRLVIDGETPKQHEEWARDDKLAPYFAKYEHPLWKKLEDLAKKNGGHGGMDFIMMWRIITCLRQGDPFDQDVYDGVSWSVIAPLTEWSVAHRSQSIDVPDFTRGRWEKTAPLGIVT